LSLVQTLLGTLPENVKQVQQTLERVMADQYWNEAQRSHMYFYYGCFYWLMEDRSSAIEEWMKLRHTDSSQIRNFQVSACGCFKTMS